LSADGRLGWATDGETLLGVDLKKEKTSLAKLNRSWASGQFAAFSPDSRWVAAGDQYNVRVWDLQSGKEQPMFEEDEIQWSGVFTPDGTRLITGGRGKISVWSMQSQKRIAVLATAGTYYVQCLAASPDNLHVAAIPGSAGQDIQVFRIPTE
jgi:WD40 repeat protein